MTDKQEKCSLISRVKKIDNILDSINDYYTTIEYRKDLSSLVHNLFFLRKLFTVSEAAFYESVLTKHSFINLSVKSSFTDFTTFLVVIGESLASKYIYFAELKKACYQVFDSFYLLSRCGSSWVDLFSSDVLQLYSDVLHKIPDLLKAENLGDFIQITKSFLDYNFVIVE